MSAENKIEAGSVGIIAAAVILNNGPLAVLGIIGVGAVEARRRAKKVEPKGGK